MDKHPYIYIYIYIQKKNVKHANQYTNLKEILNLEITN